MKSPCYKCPDRKVGCHGKCEKYQAFADFREADREKQAKRRKQCSDYGRFREESVAKTAGYKLKDRTRPV